MTDEIPFYQQNEIKQVPSFEAETEQVDIKVESPPIESGGVKFSVPETLIPQLFEQTSDPGTIFELSKQTSDTGTIFKHLERWREYGEVRKRNSEGTWSVQSLALLITVMGMLSGAVYLALFNFHDAFPISAVFKTVNFSTWELLTFSKVATGSFLVITTVTTTFILSMGVNTVAVCFVFRKFAWRTFYTILSLSAIAAFSLSFFAMLSKFVPYSITIAGGKIKVSAIFIVIFYDIYAITLVCTLACTAQCLSSFCCKQDADIKPPIVV